MEGSIGKMNSVYHDESKLGYAGKQLRVEGNRRNEEEVRQMLRLSETENKELKNSLKYVEIQLAKMKQSYKDLQSKYEEAAEEVGACHEQINRQTNINHAQA